MTDESVNHDSTDEPSKPSLLIGRELAVAREKSGQTQDDVAAALRLRVDQINHIESDDFAALGPTTFAKGYIRAYAKLLQLDGEALLAHFPHDEDRHLTANMQSFSRRTEKEAHDKSLMLISYIILATLIGSSLLFVLWPSEPANTTASQTQTTRSLPVTDAVISPLDDNEPVDLGGSDTGVENAPATNLESAAEEAALLEQTQTPNANLADEQNPQSTEPNTINSASSEQALAADVADTTPVTETQDDGLQTVVMQFSGDSWVEMFDATGERVAFGVKKAGYTMTVNGVAPFSVVLGKHDVVNIEFEGQTVDISDFPKNRLAKFELPLNE